MKQVEDLKADRRTANFWTGVGLGGLCATAAFLPVTFESSESAASVVRGILIGLVLIFSSVAIRAALRQRSINSQLRKMGAE